MDRDGGSVQTTSSGEMMSSQMLERGARERILGKTRRRKPGRREPRDVVEEEPGVWRSSDQCRKSLVSHPNIPGFGLP